METISPALPDKTDRTGHPFRVVSVNVRVR